MMLGKPCCMTMQIALLLLLIGGINWGLVAIEGKDLFALLDLNFDILGVPLARIVYALVGLAAVYVVIMKSNLLEKVKVKK